MMRAVLTLSIALSVSSVSGCAWLPERVEYVTVSPPAELLTRCEPPELRRVDSPRQAALVVLDLRQAWAQCNAHHDALINWIGT